MKYGEADGDWCKVEIMGHTEHIGRAREVPFLDGKALRVCDETEQGPVWYGLGAIFSLRWMTDEEGAKESAKRVAAHEEQGKRHARGTFIGGIQDTIRGAIDGKKMTLADIREAVDAVKPEATDDDIIEAIDWMGLDVIHPDGAGPNLYWIDPDGMPF